MFLVRKSSSGAAYCALDYLLWFSEVSTFVKPVLSCILDVLGLVGGFGFGVFFCLGFFLKVQYLDVQLTQGCCFKLFGLEIDAVKITCCFWVNESGPITC